MNKVFLMRPDLFESSLLGIRHKKANLLLARGREALATSYEPNLAVLIRTKNERAGLEDWISYINKQKERYKGRIDIVVVDTESADGTRELARKHTEEIVNIRQSEFTYPKSINWGLERVKPDVEIAFVTVGHAYPVLNNCFQAGSRHFADKNVVGVYGKVEPYDNASVWEATMLARVNRFKNKAQKINSPSIGVMAATNCMLRMSAWKQHKFDEEYGAGAEDGAWARWAHARGYDIILEPAMTVHHTHSLSLINTLREVEHWSRAYYLEPKPFNEKDLKRRRPDLFR